MVGEIRDLDTGSIATKAALTGHLVLSTLHTNDAPSAIGRLIDMGIEPFLVASSVNLILAQRLVRRPCASCRERVQPHPEALRELELSDEEAASYEFMEGKGCVRVHEHRVPRPAGRLRGAADQQRDRDLILDRASARPSSAGRSRRGC